MTPDPRPRPSLIVPVLAVIVAVLSFWIAASAPSWPMALAGLAAWLLALSYVRLPKRARSTVEVVAFDLDQVSDPTPAVPAQRPTASINR